MPVVIGTVAGRCHNIRILKKAKYTRVSPKCRSGMKYDYWEATMIERWKREGVGDERIALRTMRSVREISRFDPVRPNGRRA